MNEELENVVEQGAFISSLTRNNRQIRSDRATAIMEDAELYYKRSVENLEVDLKKLKRDRDNMLDLSPENVTTLKVASDFDAAAFTSKDIELSIKIRNTEIALDVARSRYNYLFGK